MLDQAKEEWLRAVMYDRGLSPAARVLGEVLISDFSGATCAPDIDALAVALCVSRRTTQRALDQLAQAGWLTITKPGKRGNSQRIALIERNMALPLGPCQP
jgi:MarR-like DNA-binding transcriptional regulator SgrR of sgrS sRNA